MTDPQSPDDIDAYLRQYRDKYTRDAMAAKLLEAGHDPAAVEASLARLESEHWAGVDSSVAAADERIAASLRLTRIVVLIVYGLIAFLALNVLPAPTMLAPSRLAFMVLAIALGLLVAWIVGRSRSLAAMVAWSVIAVVFGLPLVFLGACLAGFTSAG